LSFGVRDVYTKSSVAERKTSSAVSRLRVRPLLRFAILLSYNNGNRVSGPMVGSIALFLYLYSARV